MTVKPALNSSNFSASKQAGIAGSGEVSRRTGNGWAAGANTQANCPGSPAAVNFRSCDSHDGIFTMQSSYDVGRYKDALHGEGPASVTIRQIDPQAVLTCF